MIAPEHFRDPKLARWLGDAPYQPSQAVQRGARLHRLLDQHRRRSRPLRRLTAVLAALIWIGVLSFTLSMCNAGAGMG